MRKRITLALLSMLLVPLAMMAQSVTISPSTGKLIAAISDNSQETGFQNGLSALWRHEQLPMNLTTSDYTTLTVGGEFATPTSNMCVNQTTGLLTVLGGQSNDSHLILSLPKGYRFKGYEIVVVNNLNGQTVRPTANNTFALGSTTKTLVELKGGFSGEEVNSTAEMGTTNSETEYTLSRDGQVGEWSNQLYFKITHSSNVYYGLTIKSFKVVFTAEGTFETQVASLARDVAKSMVMVPFKTNKMDIGAVQSSEKNGSTFYAYTYNKVHDIDAYTYIYQNDAVQDGIPMDVATNKKISPVRVDGKEYFAFENGIYYVEAPTQVYSQTGLTYPIGMRIVGAKFTPQWGSNTASVTDSRTEYYITYTSGSTTYYLNDQLRFTTTKFGWMFDEETKNFYIGTVGSYRYLSCEGSGDTRTLTLSSLNGSWYNLIAFTRNNTNYVGWDNSTSSQRYYLKGNTNNTLPTVVRNSTSNTARYSSGQGTFTVPGYTPGSYTLKVYDNTGTSAPNYATKAVNSASDAGAAIDLSAKSYGYNNDAIKFEITGLTGGAKALVDVSVFMQALNPYIDKMEVTCHDSDNQLSMSQNFDAEDFKVSGGVFNFYIPYEYRNKDLTFSFENLWSQYGDNTYFTGQDLERDGYARYSFVTSSYFEPIDLNGDNGLYDTAYNPNASYVNKVKTTKAGNIRYKFNNAENLSNTATNPPAVSYLEEYPFSVANYIGSADPDGGTETGAFNSCVLNAQTASSDIFYLFTADETRYNIAPSTAWQHRYYAFYRMDINLATQTYDPKLTWTKVYDNTCIWDSKTKKDVDKSMWGLKLQTVVHNTNTLIEGYMTVKEIDDAITADLGKTNCPTSADQILYVDGSELYSIINSTVTTTPEGGGDPVTTTMTLETLKNKIATNALFYLPSRTTSTLSNFASKSGTGFRAGKDIEITDKQPFYAPYDIQVDLDNKAKYSREVTWEKYGATTKQSLILPFTLAISDGVYSGSSTFTVTQLTNQALTDDATNNCVTAKFAAVGGEATQANMPYLVDISYPTDGTFVVEQNGSLIKATSAMKSDYMFYGQEVKATYTGDGTEHSFYPRGSFSGKIYDRTTDDFAGSNVFFYYGSNDMFRSSAALNTSYNKLWAYPFRAFYGYTAPANGSKLAAFMFSYGSEETDGISDIAKRIDFALQSGKGYLQIISGKDANVRINSLNGMQIATEQMSAGDTRTINLPSGVYIVNGMKVIVK